MKSPPKPQSLKDDLLRLVNEYPNADDVAIVEQILSAIELRLEKLAYIDSEQDLVVNWGDIKQLLK